MSRSTLAVTEDAKHLPFGQILLTLGKLTPQERDRILQLQTTHGQRFGEIACALGLISTTDVEDVLTHQLGYPYLQPRDSSAAPELVCANDPDSSEAEAIRAIRSHLERRWFAGENKSLAIASVGPGEGTSVFAANLAIAFSQTKRRTVLLHANLSRPRQQSLFGLGRTSLRLCRKRPRQLHCYLVRSANPAMKSPPITESEIISAVRIWLEQAVIGLNLCPFAKSVYIRNRVRLIVSDATTPEALADDLMTELSTLNAADPKQIDTTLLIHPHVLQDFTEYNDFLGVADAILDEMGLTAELQVASFHPDYQFAGTGADDITNYTNRSPFPILHLLRESSIEAAIATYPDTDEIYRNNMETLRRLGLEGWLKLGIPSGRE
jgi:hypothetical protein